MTTKMAGRLTVQELVQIAARYEVWNSVFAVQRWWHTVKGRNATICQETIKNCHSKLLTTGSITDAPRSGLPSTSWSEENVALVRDMFTRSPRKSKCQAARKSGLSRHMVGMVLKKDLNFRLWKPHYVQELTPEDCDHRMEYGEFSISAVSSVDIIAITGQHTIPKCRRCTGQNLTQWNNWRTGFGMLSPTSHMTSCRRLWIPSPVVWGSWWMPPVPTLNFKLRVHIPI